MKFSNMNNNNMNRKILAKHNNISQVDLEFQTNR